MPKEKCQPNAHEWTCQTTEGELGEIKLTRQLTPDQIELILTDNSKVDEVCPDGIVMCNRCEEPFIPGGQVSQNQLLEMFDKLHANLLR